MPDINDKYSLTFNNPIAIEVLRDILAACYFPGALGDAYMSLDPNDPVMIGKYNAGLEIAFRTGILRSIGVHLLGLGRKDLEPKAA